MAKQTPDRAAGDSVRVGTRARGWTFGWGVAGVFVVLSWPALRLGTRGVATMRDGLSMLEWVALAALVVVFGYGEGVLALGRRWVPRALERTRRLSDSPHRAHVRLLAPLHAMGLVGHRSDTLFRNWAGVGAIIGAVWVVRRLPDPWRGMIGFAVAVALAWGAWTLVRGAAASLPRPRGR